METPETPAPSDAPWHNLRYCPQCGGNEFERRVPRRDDKERLCCKSCTFVHYLGPKLAAGAVLHEGNRFCLVRRAWDPGRGLWSFPGGFVDLAEEPSDAALREVREETGFEARLGRLLGVYRSQGPRGMEVVIVAYAATPTGETSSACEEVAEVKWFDETELPWAELAFESTARALRDFLSSS